MNQQVSGSPADAKYLARSFFCYGVQSSAAFAPAASLPLTFNVAKDSDFFWTKFGVHVVSASDGTTVSNELLPEITATITNTTNGRSYSNIPIPLANMSGNGRLPFILPMVTLWEAMSTISITLLNTSDNTTYSNVYLSFLGVKAFLKAGSPT